MPKRRCSPCGGSGKVMGGGMVMADCNHCDGRGKYDEPEDDMEFLLTKESERYKSAVERIKTLDPNLTDAQAQKIFDDELNNVNATDAKDGKQNATDKRAKHRKPNPV